LAAYKRASAKRDQHTENIAPDGHLSIIINGRAILQPPICAAQWSVVASVGEVSEWKQSKIAEIGLARTVGKSQRLLIGHFGHFFAHGRKDLWETLS